MQVGKNSVVEELKEKLQSAEVVFLTDYRGLNVKEVSILRNKLRAENIEYRVVKNNLVKRAAEKIGLEEFSAFFEGPVAISFGFSDLVKPAKILVEFAKEHKNLQIKGGWLKGKIIRDKEINELASLPPKEVLLLKVVSLLQSPLSNLVTVLQMPLKKLVYILKEIEKDKRGRK